MAYFLLGAVWSVLAISQWGLSESMVAKVGITLMAVANLAMGVVALRRQASGDRPDTPGG